jgi:alkanesulfonate monooxygenase SsuD/methylene tetrahydromethanopterin reductase-like flavin-dependent oxidoreductase (luciferase family)
LRTAARFAQHWNFVGGTPEDFARKVEILHGHCADVGRDPMEIVLSSHIMFDGDPAASAASAAALRDVGCQLGIVTMRPPHSPAVLESIANALAPLA